MSKLPSAQIEIRCSKMLPGQIGLFAVRNLIKGTIIGQAEWLGEKFYSWEDHNHLDQKTRLMVEKYCVGTPLGFLGPENLDYLSQPWFMNHSCAGNVGFNAHGDFVTIRYVRENEELTYDYALVETNSNFKLVCRCGAENCRKIITGDDWKNPVFRKKNLNFMVPELR